MRTVEGMSLVEEVDIASSMTLCYWNKITHMVLISYIQCIHGCKKFIALAHTSMANC